MKSIKSVLIFSNGELIGDAFLKMPAIQRLPELFPDAEITWLSGKNKTIFETHLKDIAEGYIHTIINGDGYGDDWHSLFRWNEFEKRFGKNHYDVIIDTQRTLLGTLILRKIPHNTFVSSSANWFFSDVKPAHRYKKPPHMRDQFFDLIELGGGKTVDRDYHLEIPENFMAEAKRLLDSTGPKILLAPGAGERSKCWPLEKYIDLGGRLAARGIVTHYILGPQELEWRSIIQGALPNAGFPLQESTERSVYLSIALARVADFSVASDGGVSHILAAGDKDILTLWGPTSPKKFMPNGKNVHILTAQEFGGRETSCIPVDAVETIILSHIRI